jgi:hypothetical protein
MQNNHTEDVPDIYNFVYFNIDALKKSTPLGGKDPR